MARVPVSRSKIPISRDREDAYGASPRNWHLGLQSYLHIQAQWGHPDQIHSFILDCVRSGLGNLFFSEGQDHATMKFKIPTTQLVWFLLLARGPTHGSASWVLG